tara:strand:- start:304 stop:465 length:162 start_codon:yes stop_codon:yes gene_type:complete
VYLPAMLNISKKNLKTYIKQIPNFQSLITAKMAIYFGLVAYWGIILFGTFFNI